MDKKSGKIKWFDATKGFGFVVSDQGGPDILLHANVLKDFGHSSVLEGTLVDILVAETERGSQVAQILSLQSPTIDPVEALRRADIIDLDLSELDLSVPLQPARVKWFDRAKGFGFVNVFESTADVFIHIEILRAYGMAELEQGEAVGVKIADGPRGKMAIEIRPWEYAAKTI
jgi:CspA family cold shock protein